MKEGRKDASREPMIADLEAQVPKEHLLRKRENEPTEARRSSAGIVSARRNKEKHAYPVYIRSLLSELYENPLLSANAGGSLTD